MAMIKRHSQDVGSVDFNVMRHISGGVRAGIRIALLKH